MYRLTKIESFRIRAALPVVVWLGLNAPVSALIVNVNPDVNDRLAPAQQFLQAGRYHVRVIGVSAGGIADAWTPWSFTSCANPSGCALTTPTTLTGWMTKYDVISPNLVAVQIDGQELAPVTTFPASATQDFYLKSPALTLYEVAAVLVYPTPAAALANARDSVFTLGAPGVVGFAINDIRPLADNRGGLSLEVTPVPIPGAVWMLAAGALSLLARRRGALD